MKLIPNWKKGWRMLSVQAQAIALAIVGVWQTIPADMRASVPSWSLWALLSVVLLGGILGRLIDQPKTRAP